MHEKQSQQQEGASLILRNIFRNKLFKIFILFTATVSNLEITGYSL